MGRRRAGGWSRLFAVPGFVVGCVAYVSAGVAAQEGTHVDLGVGASTFIDYPSQFAERFCAEEDALGLSGTGAIWLTSFMAAEVSALVAAGLSDQGCIFPASPLPLDTPIQETVVDDEVREAAYFSTAAALLVEPFHGRDMSPRGRIGVGRLWGKDLGTWFWALGLRYRFGRHSLLMDVERWNFTIDARLETRIFHSAGGMEVLSSEPAPQTARPYHVRVGWEIELR